MTLSESSIAFLKAEVESDELITQRSNADLYVEETKCWSAQKDLHPTLVLRPKTLQKLQLLLPFLYNPTAEGPINFAIRSGGIGNSSATDIILSMRAFTDVAFEPKTEIVTLGAGLLWGELDQKMREIADGYAVVGARIPYVGVAGAILSGGYSWLSHEYGLTSDPQNLLDVQIVLKDGRVVWAAEEGEPDLLWALRGGGGNFGVVTAFKLQARKYPQHILGGTIIFPESSLEAVSKGVAYFATGITDPRVSMHVYFLEPRNPFFPFPAGIGLMIFDANGEEHGRSEHGFKWAFDIEGAVDLTKEMTLFDVHDATAYSGASKGATDNWLCGAMVPNIDPEFVIRAFHWYKTVLDKNEAYGSGTFLLLEMMQKAVLASSASPEATAWPHKDQHQYLSIGTGFIAGSDSGCSEKEAIELLQQGLEELVQQPVNEIEFFPNLGLFFTDSKKLYGVNYPKLQELKRLYDPEERFNRGLFIEPS